MGDGLGSWQQYSGGNISISSNTDNFFIFCQDQTGQTTSIKAWGISAVFSLGGKYGSAINVRPGKLESGARKQHNSTTNCEGRH